MSGRSSKPYSFGRLNESEFLSSIIKALQVHYKPVLLFALKHEGDTRALPRHFLSFSVVPKFRLAQFPGAEHHP